MHFIQFLRGSVTRSASARELWSMRANMSVTEATTHRYASSLRLMVELHTGQVNFLASAILRNEK